mmetsp:Transcript_17548/g.25228  ORF Transcript_17548/g.25228 Transcript_17548/m.25228 type:complete len:149 (+) Transcript_17548:1696-2142(+)
MFYGGKLVSGVTAEQRPAPRGIQWRSRAGALMFVKTESPEQPQGTSFANTNEAAVVGKLLKELLNAGEFSAEQGRQKEVIVFSAVRCNKERHLGFTNDWKLLNVALTRARRGLVVVGSEDTLSADKTWARWLKSVHDHACSVGEEDFR